MEKGKRRRKRLKALLITENSGREEERRSVRHDKRGFTVAKLREAGVNITISKQHNISRRSSQFFLWPG